jgi:hypothetical protein
MPKVTSLKTSSVSFGRGPCKPDPLRPLRPVHTSPDVVDVREQKNKGQQLKQGLTSSKPIHHNPGR